MDTAVLLAIFGILSLIISVVIVGLFKLIDKLSTSLDSLTASNQRIADEARERNGHLAQITIEARDTVLRVIQEVGEQHVTKQVVDKQTIKGKK